MHQLVVNLPHLRHPSRPLNYSIGTLPTTVYIDAESLNPMLVYFILFRLYLAQEDMDIFAAGVDASRLSRCGRTTESTASPAPTPTHFFTQTSSVIYP